MGNRGEERDSKMSKMIKTFKIETVERAKRDGNFYVILKVLKKIKYKYKGKTNFEKPLFAMLVDISESNLPMPANAYNPVFMFKRQSTRSDSEGKPIGDSDGDEYAGTPTPEDYFTLPDISNAINSDAPVASADKMTYDIGLHYLSSVFLQNFDNPEAADLFLNKVVADVERFLKDLSDYVERNQKTFDWESLSYNGSTRNVSKSVTVVKGMGTVVSFSEGRAKDVALPSKEE
ncbi:Uncharacterised protein [uncultured archaeon]|nr:Uncharacterised protein [uncultured archaeon]